MNKGKWNTNKGITMVSLIITIVVIFIIAGTTVHTSLKRFEINELSKMYNDIKLLSDKVANYYLRYNGLPVVKDSSNNSIIYPISSLNFDKNVNDNSNYYILDLKAMEGLSLNYGEEGLNNSTVSAKDIYIVNEASHVVYYVKGIEVDGIVYHTLPNDENAITDKVPPSKPEIRVVSGTKNQSGTYTGEVELEIVPGKDSWTGVNRTTYSINNGTEKDISTLTNNVLKISEEGTNEVKAKSYDRTGNISQEESITIEILPMPKIGDKVNYNEGYSATKTNTVDSNFTMDNMDWRVLDIDETSGTVKLISSRPTTSKLTLSGKQGWLDAETKLDTLCSQLYANGTGVTARSLKVEDIDKLANMLTPEARKAATSDYGSKWRYKYDATAGKIQYSKQNDDGTWTDYENTGYSKFKDPRYAEINSSHYQDAEGNPIIADLECTSYSYTISSKIPSTVKTADNILVSDLITKGLNKDTGAANSSNITQWLSSRCVICYSNHARFFVRRVIIGDVIYDDLWHSYGWSYSPAYAVRPVVLLNSDALTVKENGIWQVQL